MNEQNNMTQTTEDTEVTTKVCTMCGDEKPLDEFRPYPKGDKRYPYCLECQAIENRRRYLVGKSTLDIDQQIELDVINELYDKRIENGLDTFNRTKSSNALDLARQQLSKLA